ncbi:MAG: DUF2007 domain-containing protein [Bacteroidales bacterium]|nr:DUF2007 domain-containing protein [Bacteroidales bacterium]
MKTIRLMTCESAVEANIIKGRLKNEGIECFIANENFSNLMPNYNNIMGSGAQILIRENDLELARQTLEMEAKKQLVCPQCQSQNVKISLGNNKIRKLVIIFISLITATPFNNINVNYICKDCQSVFK